MSAGSILEMRAAGEAGAVSEGLKAPSRNFRSYLEPSDMYLRAPF